ncbi:GDP-mannose pyrophosphatase NudK [Flavihumibacter sp. UBA7668]|uniref:GDP-mannose pyrophosphatase NudK n=1 Tax=Flavihumibacter sp. UBA7668 TaxID=1946542 RepID=UPI0025BE472E|nr:GDP-mannose pyrophosphatase NudK [Flavihumibacter sp. UBA7668]
MHHSPAVKIHSIEILSDNWYVLRKVHFDYQLKNGNWQRQDREAYDRGNGAVILLYNQESRTIVLTRQFRMPTYINGNPDGMLIEACAGLLDQDQPADAIRRETEEETGFRLKDVTRVFDAYMSPGSVTEKLYFFIAAYDHNMKIADGGGIDQEEIEVLEIPIEDAFQMIDTGEIQDGKTILLIQHLRLKGIL